MGLLCLNYDKKGDLYLIRGGEFNMVCKNTTGVTVSKYSNYTVEITFPTNSYTLLALFIGGDI